MPSKRRGINRQQITKKDAAKDDFFGIDEQWPLAHWGLHVLAGVVFVIFAIWVWLLNPVPQIHPDQMNIVTMILSKEHPDNFTRDTVFSSRAAEFYPPLSRGIISSFIKRFGLIGGHRVIQFPLSIAYLLVMYGTLYYLTRSVPAAVLVTLASLIWRDSMGGTYWGLDRLQAVQPRSFVLVFTPALFVLFWKFRDSWKLLIPSFVLGILFNLNPPSAFCFALLVWSSLFLFGWDNRERILRLVVGGFVMIAGALPYIYVYMFTRSSYAGELSPQQLQEYMNALQYRFSQMSFFPLPASIWAKVLAFGFAGPLFLATIAWCMRKEKRNVFDSWLVCFFLLAFVGTIVAQYIVQLICAHFKTEPFWDNLMRGHKYVFLVLYIYICWLLAELFRRFTLRDRCILIIVSAMIVAIMPPFKNNSQDPWGQWHYNTAQAGALFGGEKIEIAGWHIRIAQVATWAKQNTPKDSLFLFVHRFMSPFRMYALRSMVSSQECGGVARSDGPRTLTIWAKYQQELEWITAKRDISRLLSLAEESGADYIITPNDFPRVTGWVSVFQDVLWTVYKRP